MKQLFVAAFASLLLACGNGREQAPSENTANSSANEFENAVDTVVSNAEVLPAAINNWSIEEIDSSGWMMMKLYLNGEQIEKSGNKVSLYGSRESAPCWNIFFYNSRSSEQHLLTDQRMIFSSTEVKSSINYPSGLDSVILYQTIIDDLNKDGKLNDGDGYALFISDRSGKHFRRITPKGLYISQWQFMEASNSLLLTCMRDSNKDQQIKQSEDERLLFQWSLTRQDGLTPVVSKASQQKINDLLQQHWTVKQQ